MKNYEFTCYASSGRGDGIDWTMEYEISQEQEQRIIRAIENGAETFSDDKSLEDIYEEIYDALIQEQVNVYLNDETLLDTVHEYLYALDYDDADDGEEYDYTDEADAFELTEEEVRDYLEDAFEWGIYLPQILVEEYADL